MPPRKDASNEFDTSARADQTPVQPPFQPSLVDWEAVSLPGMLPVDAIPHAPERDSRSAGSSSSREAELLALIQDLNRCNEVLLSRVNQLEESLEKSQQALHQEVERSHQRSEEEKMTVAQQHSVAQLLSELEESDAALKRQTILAETLQAQLATYQERSRQLEKECTLLQKHHTEKTQKLVETEETCRDLRARLQRQQRYTLQFKVALEKSLDTSAFNHIPAEMQTDLGRDLPQLTESTTVANPSAMPRSGQIRPWSAMETGGQADPQLLSLVRSLNEPPPAAPAPTTSLTDQPAISAPPELTVDGEAEKQLWQDVERVIENSTLSTDAGMQKPAETSQASSNADEVQFTEPMPWGAPIKKEPQVADANPQSVSVQPAENTTDALPTEVVTSVAKESLNDTDTVNTPLRPMPPLLATEIPALDAAKTSQASPSPIVHPLRPPQRKRKSLSAVELPNFPPLPKKKSE